MMSKDAKKNYVEEMKRNFTDNESVMIAQYQGLNVNELDSLRKELREKGILFKITKNRITKIAIKETTKKDLEQYFIGPTAAAISSAIWLGAISTGLGFIGYVRLIDKIGAVKTSTVAYFLPVFGIIWGAIFLDEVITSTIVIGCFIVLIGIYLSNSNKKGYVNSVNTKA